MEFWLNILVLEPKQVILLSKIPNFSQEKIEGNNKKSFQGPTQLSS